MMGFVTQCGIIKVYSNQYYLLALEQPNLFIAIE